VPSGWTILSGQGTNQLGVRTGSSTGTVTFRMTSCSVQRDLTKNIIISGSVVLDPQLTGNNMESMVTVHPNPASSTINIALTGDVHHGGDTPIRILDATGRVVKQYYFANPSATRSLEVSGLRNGLYFISIYDGKKWINKKLIIHH
jgi:hypothetical protein